MGLIRSSFSFLVGLGCGVYITQNYEVPNMKQLACKWLSRAQGMEEIYRKPDKKDD